jgi:hypothetical protein
MYLVGCQRTSLLIKYWLSQKPTIAGNRDISISGFLRQSKMAKIMKIFLNMPRICIQLVVKGLPYWSNIGWERSQLLNRLPTRKILLGTYDIQLHHPIMGMGLLSQQTRWMTTAEPYKQKQNQKIATFSPKSHSANSHVKYSNLVQYCWPRVTDAIYGYMGAA